ncbi:hypothetical protein BFW38_02860 [Terasakiispira papahanaumokuakeensis]|uniref:Uncharacterized protein n=1 Tax=Terasakiispira papahanaumokuakeensis TaxID=197479 RepID=A0A1E2V6K3_9GAMM|nr:tetratricopeptide repeat protein [Terasakiispira papahanaumokuakeensis]ODC02640.1 hypothetical protein BFW38_02860 [Terasakiispira papahanaumokuakeensis]
MTLRFYFERTLKRSVLLSRSAQALTVLPLVLSATLLSGCSGLSSESTQAPHPQSANASLDTATPTSRWPSVKGLTGEQVYQLLKAEIAGQRQQLDTALTIYLDMANELRNPLLAERATWIAQFDGNAQAALDAALLWADTAPQNPDAQRTAAGLLLQNRQYLEALDHLQAFKALTGESNYSLIARHAIDEAPETLGDLYQEIQTIETTPSPKGSPSAPTASADIETALALLANALGNTQAADQHLDKALTLEPSNPQAVLLKAQRLSEQHHLDEAEALLTRTAQRQARDLRLWLELARVQLLQNKLTAAQNTFNHLLDLQPDNPQLRFALAQLYLETGKVEAAHDLLDELTRDPRLADQAHLRLGRLAEAEGQPDEALLHYRAVQDGDALVEAALSAGRLLQQQGRLDEALEMIKHDRQQHPSLSTSLTLVGHQLLLDAQTPEAALKWLNQALAHDNPNDTAPPELRYARAMTWYRLGNIPAMEADLRALLEDDPNNALYLNALGYTLVDETQRTSEGLMLIRKAHALDEDAPEIIDSLGWALFKLGQPEEAREHLERAYQLMPEEEIGTHLAEVLWALGEHDQAHQLIRQMKQQLSKTPLLDKLLQRRPEMVPSSLEPSETE